MAERIRRKELLKQEDAFTEAGHDAQEWIEKHWRRVALVAGIAFAVVLIFALWTWWVDHQEAVAGSFLTQGLEAYHPPAVPGAKGPAPAPRYAEALALFEKAERAAGSRPMAGVAAFYRGAALHHLGRNAEAIPILEGIAARGDTGGLDDSAALVLGETLVADGKLERAAEVFDRLSKKAGATVAPELALLRLAEVRQAQGKTDEARRIWKDVADRFPQSPAASEARERMSR